MVVTRAKANAQRQAEERDVDGEGARSDSASPTGETVSPRMCPQLLHVALELKRQPFREVGC